MARRSDIVVSGGGVGHHSIQVASSQQGVSVSHSVSNGVAVSWSGHPTSLATPPVLDHTGLDGEVRAALARMMTSRLLGMASVTSGITMATATSVAVFLLGAPLVVLAAWVPAALLLTVGGFLAFRGGSPPRGVSESQVLESAHRRGGTLTVATLALDTGRGMADCQKQLDAMAAAGWVTMDVDDDGLLTYRIASLDQQRHGSGASRTLPTSTPHR